MNLTQFICIITLISSFDISAQENMVLKDGKQIMATKSWTFLCENYALTGKSDIQFAKTQSGGILKISVDTVDPDFFIGGTTYIYLSDFTAIACTDKNLRANSENGTAAYYYLTIPEMNRLKKLEIQSIRFNIRGKSNTFSSQTGNFTALNKKSFFGTFGKEEKNSFETAKEIALLYK
ncbi:hypothetical protein FNO01nite_16540 [Flavobacterium noncentrifugens]|uniref:Uncharacterized protein n=1 Tax=Flavobacterium noncentrifugens TaxID=1128970 RepID=A0A1G8WNM7_9FLAO|nr:hypothetical protein [Flavobacterium noncentrifugens]GEP50982.1 hypothetical protein FNO01nite_16540 [Flavobacterium noncentrifugens]SDJ79235.1 hypothetical protein SAMN04487935_1872 [Flavobacterium noncentrifugens]